MALTVHLAEFVFWLCLLAVAYTYFLYPLLLFVAYCVAQIWRDWRFLSDRRERRTHWLAPEELPAVSMIMAAHNEQNRLPDKIANIREIDYPREKLEVIFVSDGSTDRTNEILRALPDENIRAILLPKREGKANALNHGVAQAQFDILIMCDAPTLLVPDAVRSLVRHFSDPRVGLACGTLELRGTEQTRQTEVFYWNYERMLRLMEGRLGATLHACGPIYALRRQCYFQLPADILIEDFAISLNARRLGYRVVDDPEARATDFTAVSVAGEFTRRVRLAVGSFAALGSFLRFPWKGFSGLAFVSHKLLRWILPFLLVGLLLSNVALWGNPVYAAILIAQLFFYLWASVGFLLRHRRQRIRYALMGYFLLTIHLAFLVGFLRFLARRKEALWQRVN